MVIAAIDPGKTGGIAWRNNQGLVTALPFTSTMSDDDIVELITVMVNADIYYVEQVGGYIGKPQPGSRMFNFGKNYGILLGALSATNKLYITVRPQTWMKSLGLVNKEKLPSQKWKNVLKDYAKKLYPKARVTLSTSDALLILNYACDQVTHACNEED